MQPADSDNVVLVSGFGDDGRGGVFALTDDGVEILDSVATVGLAFSGDRLGRLLRAPFELTSTAELVVYDDRGVLEYRRLDAVRDPHDLVPFEQGWIVVSTGTNEIVAIDAEGALRTVWRGPGEPDAWHVNCVAIEGPDLYASAFGEFTALKEWRSRAAIARGMLWNVHTGATLVRGLTHPHSPRLIDGAWLICESYEGRVTRFDDQGAPSATLETGGYPRGVAVDGDRLVVGVSATRDDLDASAFIAFVDRASLTLRARLPVPCREIYDVLVVPAAFADAVRTGFATNAYRLHHPILGTMPAGQWSTGTTADRDADRCRVRAALPAACEADDRWNVEVEIENTGRSWLGSVEPKPVFVASRWVSVPDGTQIDGERVPLPVVLAPGQRTLVTLPITAPAEEGVPRLRVSLVREGEYWFDDIDPDAAAVTLVDVRKRSPNA